MPEAQGFWTEAYQWARPLYTYRGTQAMMKQLTKDDAGGWSTPVPPREKSPERETTPVTTPEQIRADAECVLVAH